ncbi:hypothetical protein CsatA_022399 [Cannabis sativa]
MWKEMKEGVWTMICVVMRKNIQMISEMGMLFKDFFWVLTSTLQFSGIIFRPTTAVSGNRYHYSTTTTTPSPSRRLFTI